MKYKFWFYKFIILYFYRIKASEACERGRFGSRNVLLNERIMDSELHNELGFNPLIPSCDLSFLPDVPLIEYENFENLPLVGLENMGDIESVSSQNHGVAKYG